MSNRDSPASPPSNRSGVAYLWRRVVLAREGYADPNRVTHGAFGFNTAAKALAWIGLCAVVLKGSLALIPSPKLSASATKSSPSTSPVAR